MTGTRIIQRGRGHSYELDGAKVPGVTTILGDGFPKPALVNWAARFTAEFAVDRWAELSELAISERLRRIERARWDELSTAGERGREVHALGQAYLAGEPITPPEELAGHLEAYIQFEHEWTPEEEAVEAACFSREWNYGGRFDLIAVLADGRRWLLDYKTSRSGVFPETALQLAAYRNAEFYILADRLLEGEHVEFPMPQIDQCGVVWLRADGYDLLPLEADAQAFAVFLAVREVAQFAKSSKDDWIGEALRPPVREEPSGV